MNDGSTTVASSTFASCCIVGGGPAGVLLSLLLARKGIAVTLLEAHADFDRDFRGDTVHPSTLEVLDQIGLADRLLELPHGQMRFLRLGTLDETLTLADLARLRTRFPYVAMIPQNQFLEFLVAEARKFPTFDLRMKAAAIELMREEGEVVGVRYHDAANQVHEVRAPLVIAADGRFSKLRSLAGLVPVATAPPMDVLWFRLPRRPEDGPDEGQIRAGQGHILVMLNRGDEWQIGFVYPKGGYQELKRAGIEAVRGATLQLAPWLGDRVQVLTDWHQCSVLSVESSRLAKWHLPGLLLLGDAAHVMSPVGGVGINVAIQDAVVAANHLFGPLRSGKVTEADLAAIQREREWPVRIMQGFQRMVQQRVVAQALAQTDGFHVPWLVRLLPHVPLLRNLPARLVAFGPRRVRLAPELI